MGSGGSKKSPTILKAFHPEQPDTIIKEQTQQTTGDVQQTAGDMQQTVGDEGIQSEQQPDSENGNQKEAVNETGSNTMARKENAVGPDFVKTIVGANTSPWPVRTFVKLEYNVNAYHGGAAGLMLISCSFGGKGEETNSEAFLLRSGFDCNHYDIKSVHRDHQGHFGAENCFRTDEKGTFVADCLFGNNHVSLLTNDSRYGNLRNGVFVQSEEGESPTPLPLNINGTRAAVTGSGLTLVICSGLEGGSPVSSLYMVRSGFKDNKFRSKLFAGEDKFQFSEQDGNLFVTGPIGARYSLFHNRNNLEPGTTHAFVAQTQCADGKVPQVLCEKTTDHSTFVVMCSNSNDSEDSTVASIYCVTVADKKVVSTKEIAGHFGKTYTSSDLWTFEVKGTRLDVTGPGGPNRYGLMSNLSATAADLISSLKQSSCLATGETTQTESKVKVTWEEVTGEVNKQSSIHIMWNHKNLTVLSEKDLQKDGNKFTFTYKWPESEKVVGHHLIRIFAIRKHVQSGEEVFIELTGSPQTLIQQKEGVAFAVNCAGPAHQALTDVVYFSDFSKFANFDPSVIRGQRFLCLGDYKQNAKLPGSMLKSDDGFLYARMRHAIEGLQGENYFQYTVEDIPNGDYIFRFHSCIHSENMVCNGEEISQKIRNEFSKHKGVYDIENFTCYTADVPVKVRKGVFQIMSRFHDSSFRKMEKMCAWALLDKAKYKEKSLSATQIKDQVVEKQKLADKISPLHTSVTRKEMTIVGWSPNLLQNSSAELGTLKHWNTSGDFKIETGGFGTEMLMKTSHMWTSKYQEVNLLENFTAEYLDTSPDIQVMEMYHEGHCGGGFYVMEVQLLNEDGEVLKEYSTGQMGNLYKNNVWQEASHTFTGYGTGVRMVGFSSKGKDDKFWAGHFGTMMSAASVRVKRETKHAEGDAYCDVKNAEKHKKSEIEKLVTQVITDNQELLQDLVTEENLPVDEAFEKQTALEPVPKTNAARLKRKKRKKREIRVFVSSTFRDFSKEREEIIKKAFREINRLCSDRGVFFTYVDLRWGITSEQTNDGKTIAICLQEIDRCRPYFICLMGERFGWSQTSESKDEVLNMTFDYAIDNHPNMDWIEKYRYDSSVTQLEVFHGVLNNPTATQGKSFFYMRDPVKQGNLTDAEYKRLVSESEWHKEQQDRLKSEVMKHKDNVNITRFETATEVAELIKKDLERCVDEDFPKGTELTKLEQQKEAHTAFAEARCRVYIGRNEYFTTINDARAQEINQPFVLLGESGCGKSAFVANWAKRVEDSEPDTFMFVHFIGSSADSANYIKLIRRLFEEMKTYYGFDMQIPSSDTHLINELGKWLRMAGLRSKVVVVLDALNQLDDGSLKHDSAEHDLLWIPSVIPPNVFLLVSTLPGRAMKACKANGWPKMKVEPLDQSQKEQIITDYLEGIYGKTMTQDQKNMIINAEQTTNALYLKSLLDEVRMFGSFRLLTDKIRDYLTAASPGDLFAKILERLEGDFEKGANQRADLVRDATTALWCSNRGMSETEIVELLDVKSAVWSPFYLSLYENLVNRDGILNFFHDHLRQAVEKKYLATPEDKRLHYLKLADFFTGKEISNRTVEELPFLLTRAGELERLKTFVSDLDVFYRLSDNEDGIFELVKAWRTLGNFSLAEEAYLQKLSEIPKQEIYKKSEYYCALYSKLGNFFKDLGLMDAAKSIYLTLIDQLEHNYGQSHGTIVYSAHSESFVYRCKHTTVIKSLQELGEVYRKLGELEKAVEIYNDAINRQNRIETPTQKLQLCEGLLGLVSVLISQDEMAEAKKLLSRALELAVDILGKKHHFVAAIFTRLGQLSYKQGRLDEALAYCMQDLKVTRSEVGTNHPRTAIILNEIALVYDDKNDELAGPLYEAALSTILDTYGKNYIGTGIIRYNLGAFFFGTNHFSKARFQFEEAYHVLNMFLGEEHIDTISAKKALDAVSSIA